MAAISGVWVATVKLRWGINIPPPCFSIMCWAWPSAWLCTCNLIPTTTSGTLEKWRHRVTVRGTWSLPQVDTHCECEWGRPWKGKTLFKGTKFISQNASFCGESQEGKVRRDGREEKRMTRRHGSLYPSGSREQNEIHQSVLHVMLPITCNSLVLVRENNVDGRRQCLQRLTLWYMCALSSKFYKLFPWIKSF